MAYVSDSNLTQFWGLAKDYINAEDGRFANWQKTEKAGAVTCWPVGGTPLLPTVDFLFTETGPAEGAKGPDNPSTITGVSTITVTRCETVGVDSTDYTIDLGSTYYGGSIDLATGVMAVTHNAVSLAGNTGFSSGLYGAFETCCRVGFYPGRKSKSSAYASDVSVDTLQTYVANIYNNSPIGVYITSNSTSISVCLPNSITGLSSSSTNVEISTAFNAWFAQNPTIMVYELATPLTVQLSLTEILSLAQTDKYTPRLNTVYTDAQAVQVGYAKSPIRSEYELTQAIIATEGGE